MKFENIDVTKTIEEAKNLLAAEKNLSPALRSVFTVVLMLLQVLLGKISTNSKNSSKPPSQDPNRKKTSKTKENGKKAGGQEGHAGVCLEPVKKPDEVVKIKCEKKDLPKGKY